MTLAGDAVGDGPAVLRVRKVRLPYFCVPG
jgi:hypothetical protein